MYFPFLYGRRSEFLAVRSMLDDPRDRGVLIPIFEPINSNIDDLARCLNECEKEQQRTVVVINPAQHQLANAASRNVWLANISIVLNACPSAIPAFQTSDRTSGVDLRAALRAFPGRDVAVVHNGAGLSDAEVRRASSDGRIAWHIVIGDKMPSRQQALLPIEKAVIVRDGFHKQLRNADYGGQEFFSDLYRTYPPAAGFGDFVCLGTGFQVGGSTPAAVAIHAAFKHPSTNDLWVEHFVSDDKAIDVGDVNSKYIQAARHLVNAARKRPDEFGSNQALDAYRACVRTRSFPGLAKNKEYQIVHHICVVLDILSGRL